MKKLLLAFLLISLNNLFAQIDFSTSNEANLSLARISVTIGGDFIVNGSFPALVTQRVDEFVTQIFNEVKTRTLAATKDEKTFVRLSREFEGYAKRNISLKRIDGTERKLDLAKFRLTGDFKDNPYLKNNDVIIFPPFDVDRNYIDIDGAVNKPAKIQYVKGDKLSDAIFFAGGINEAYENVTQAEISRLSYDGSNEEIIIVDIINDYDLKIGDRIRILADETQRRAYKVILKGEVNKPGNIYITKNTTTLREVIQKAGGFKENADLRKAELIRGANVFDSPIFSQQFETMLMQRMSNIDEADSASFLVDNNLRFARGNGLIDFSNVLDENEPDGDFIVKDRDYIFIPEKIDLIYIFGQVAIPGYIEFRPNEDFNYYINRAGGLGENWRGEIYLIKGKTRAWIELDEGEDYNIEPGDFIWAPKKPYRDFSYYLNQIASIAGIVGSVATIVLLIQQFGK